MKKKANLEEVKKNPANFEKFVNNLIEPPFDKMVRLANKKFNKDSFGRTFLHALHLEDYSYEKSPKMTPELKKKLQKWINEPDALGFTPIMYAAKQETPYTYDCLIALGADPTMKDPSGISALSRLGVKTPVPPEKKQGDLRIYN